MQQQQQQQPQQQPQQHSSASSPSPPPPLHSFLSSSSSATAAGVAVATTSSPKESRNLYCVLVTSLVSLLLILSFSSSLSPSPSSSSSSAAAAGRLRSAAGLLSSSPPPPSLAYLLTGSAGDGGRLLRLLRAVYHPKNLYLLHLDGSAPADERERLARAARDALAFRSARNVHVVGRPDFVNTRGSSALSATLHGAAILLRVGADWDWFVNLQASDYPLLKQDDLLHVFSFLPKDLNFVQHSSYIGWRESRRIRPIIVDPGLYLSSRNDVFYTTQKRDVPNAFRLFTGSSSVILSRKFVEYCILGTDNLPRSLLMYYANMASSHTNYFQTVLCNSPEFNRTIVNNDLHYMIWETTLKKEARFLTLDDFENITLSGAAFGARFPKDDPLLERIDKELLNRGLDMVVPGGWCLGEGNDDPCTVWGNADVLSPGPQAMVLAKVIVDLLSDGRFRSQQCIWD